MIEWLSEFIIIEQEENSLEQKHNEEYVVEQY